jgi:hypothetical protein
MNLINKNKGMDLNQYFDEAKSENPIVSAEEMLDMITPVTVTPIQKSNFFKKIGASKMTIGAITSAAALISLFVLNSTTNQIVNENDYIENKKPIELTVSEKQPDQQIQKIKNHKVLNVKTDENKEDSKIITATATFKLDDFELQTEGVDTLLVDGVAYFSMNSSDSPKIYTLDEDGNKIQATYKDKVVSGVNAIELTDEQLAELGIEINREDESIVVCVGKNEPTRHRIFADGDGEMSYIGECPEIRPNLVSTSHGTRRLASTQTSDGKQITMMQSSLTPMAQSIDLEDFNSKMLVNYQDTYETEDGSKLITDSYNIVNSATLSTLPINFDSINSTIHVVNANNAPFEIKIDALDMHIDSDSASFISALMDIVVDTIHSQAASSIKADKIKRNTNANLDISSDDMSRVSALVESTLINLNENDSNMKNLSNIEVNFDGGQVEMFFDYDKNIENKDCEGEVIKNAFQIDDMIDINTLIPISVSCPVDNDVDFKFYIWYEITPEFLDVLPHSIAQKLGTEVEEAEKHEFCEAPKTGEELYLDVWRSCSGAIEGMKIFPNPTMNTANVEFILKEDREVIVTLHDIAGNKVATLQRVSQLQRGEHNLKYDLSEFSAGMYLIVIQTSDGEQVVQRVIKN